MSAKPIELATVSAANPSRREIRLRVRKGLKEALASQTHLQLVLSDGEAMACKVNTVRPAGDESIVELAPGTTRDNVARMRDAAVMIDAPEPAQDWQALPEDLVGFQVEAKGLGPLGEVVGIIVTNANDVLEISKTTGGGMLLPLIDRVIERVDWDTQRLFLGDIEPYRVDDNESVTV